MKTTIPIALLIVLFFTACNRNSAQSNSALDDFIADLDDTSLEAAKKELNQSIKRLEEFINFSLESFGGGIKEFNKEDESYLPPFSIDNAAVERAVDQFDDVIFTQTYEDHESQLEFAFGNRKRSSLVYLNNGIYENLTPQKIYYRDGTVQTQDIEHYQTDFDFPYSWGKMAIIDSVEVKYTVEYPADYETVKLSKKNSKGTYGPGELVLKKVENNYAYITLSDTLTSFIEVSAFNSEGKRLKQNASTNNPINPTDRKKVYADLIKKMKQIHKKLEENEFKDMPTFKSYLKEELKDSDFFNNTDGIYHLERFYDGSIAYLEIYFENGSKEKQQVFTAVNMEPYKKDAIIAMETEDEWVLVNQDGEIMYSFRSDIDELEHMGGYYFQSYKNYFIFNKEKKALDTLMVYGLNVYHNGLVGIQHKNVVGDYQLYDAYYEPIPNGAYSEFQEAGDVLFGYKDDKVFLINSQGEPKLIKGISEVEGKLSDNRILVSTKDYDYGFIDREGNLVLPTIYEEASDFFKGITAVYTRESYKLIDTNGKIIVDTEETDKDTDKEDDDGNRVYSFDYATKKYNYKGEILSKE